MPALNLAPSTDNDLRIMLVDDSAAIRGVVRKWLDAQSGIRVVETADNGQTAIAKVAAARPDIIILDIEMPVMDGLTALPTLLRLAPASKILIASTLSRRNAEVSLKAMSLGASDYVAKPSFVRDGNLAREQFQEELLRKVTGMMPRSNRAVAISGAAETPWMPMPTSDTVISLRKASLVKPRILAIGASTGGPAALTRVFEDAKAAMAEVPVVLTQHMPPTFTTLLGEKLARAAGLSGGEAEHGQVLHPGHLYVAPGGKHMRLKRRGTDIIVVIDEGPPINHCRPAVDPLFDTVADIYGNAALCVVLTGMGHDGAAGALKIANAGGTVFAQDENTSVVWGMPGATAAAGACTAVVPLSLIGEKIAGKIVNRGRS